MSGRGILEELGRISEEAQRRFTAERRVLSFEEYLELFATDPRRYSRDAARYLRDLFDHFGTTTVDRPWGKLKRFTVFDLPFLEEEERRRHALVGQEHVQAELYRALSNFVREGKASRALLLHGPNGSAKSTVAACLMRGLEHYSQTSEGALYRFHWVFPSKAHRSGAIGFRGKPGSSEEGSFAHLPDSEIDSRLFIELRDHPLLLLPKPERRALLTRLHGGAGAEPPCDWLMNGELSHKSQQVFEALLASYGGSLREVYRHVQVERWFVSRRYRVGVATVAPQLSVDASERQVTSDRSLGSLPASLQSLSLFEAHGELIDAAGGLLEFSDLLKRPLDAFKYLQFSVESGEVPLRTQTVQLNLVVIASANEVHLEAFREHPEWASFRGRLELIPTPYLLSYVDERGIYDAQIAPQVRKHVAPHSTELAARFAVLTRMRKPSPDKYAGALKKLMSELTVTEKAEAYAHGTAPKRFDEESAKLFRSAIPALFTEGQSYPIYEGSVGASAREMRTMLLDAAQSTRYFGLSPFAVLEELARLAERKAEYAWLAEEKQPGGFHDTSGMLTDLRSWLLDQIERQFGAASGLVDELRYAELFERYILHVSYSLKGEKVRNPITGAYEEPDERMLREVEQLLGISGEVSRFRQGLIGRAAAWAIDHPGQPMEAAKIFAEQITRMRNSVYQERRVGIAKLTKAALVLVREAGTGLDGPQREAARQLLDELARRFGYVDESAADAANSLVRERFADVLK